MPRVLCTSPRLCKSEVPGSELKAELCPVCPSSSRSLRGSRAGLELKNTEVSVSTVSQRLPFHRLISVWPPGSVSVS